MTFLIEETKYWNPNNVKPKRFQLFQQYIRILSKWNWPSDSQCSSALFYSMP